MLAKIKNFVKNNSSDLFIVLVVVLAALIAFGVGRLSVPDKEPVLIRNMEQANVADLTVQTPETTEQGNNQAIGKVVGSKNSNKYHLPDCPGAKQISEQNKIWFNSIADAQKAGYVPASNCPGLK